MPPVTCQWSVAPLFMFAAASRPLNMVKRSCPFSDDMNPQVKIHVREKEVAKGVMSDQHMKLVYGMPNITFSVAQTLENKENWSDFLKQDVTTFYFCLNLIYVFVTLLIFFIFFWSLQIRPRTCCFLEQRRLVPFLHCSWIYVRLTQRWRMTLHQTAAHWNKCSWPWKDNWVPQMMCR